MKEATTQLRVMATRITALESQLRAKETEVEDANAAAASARDGRSETESRILQLQADLRGACADTAALTAQLGVQTALAHSREVEVEELKAAVHSASMREEVVEGTLGDTVSEVRRLKAECAKHQCLIKTQVCLFGCPMSKTLGVPCVSVLWCAVAPWLPDFFVRCLQRAQPLGGGSHNRGQASLHMMLITL